MITTISNEKQINDKLLSDPVDIPDIVMKGCYEVCPENCLNDGEWKYLNSRNRPLLDKNKRLGVKKGKFTDSKSY